MKAPTWIGKYRVISLVGVGASASVFRAVRPDDDFQVAIKVLADNHSAVTESRRRFADERKLMAALDHRSIATVYDTGETDDGRPYMVMEFANRGDLRTRVKDLSDQGRHLTAADVMTVGTHLRHALGVLRSHEVVHRDISPSNILIRADVSSDRPPMAMGHSLLGPNERLLLADLGFAKRLDEASGLTRGGGTEGFAAPEQQAKVSIVDHRSDIYSATALIEWLTSDTATGQQLANFVATGMADDPDDRHHNVEHWFQDLSDQLTQAPRTATPPKARSKPLAPAAGLAVAAVLGFLAFQGLNTDAPDEQLAVAETAEPSTTSSSRSTIIVVTTTEPATSAPATSVTALSDTATSSTGDIATSAAPTTDSTNATTTTNPFPFSPRAYFNLPVDEATVSGDLTISGTATSPNGVELVRLVIRNLDSGQYWHADVGSLQDEFVRFPVDVSSPGETDLTWRYIIPTGDIPAGTYRLRAWAQAVDGSGDPIGEMRTVTVN